MLEVTSGADLAASPEAVWELLCDTGRYAAWVSGTDRVTDPDGPAALGVGYGEVNPVLGPWRVRTHWQVTEFDPPRRQVHSSGDLPLTTRFDVVMEVDEVGAGSRLTLTLRLTAPGRLGRLVHRWLRSSLARNNAETVRNAARLLDG